MRCISHTPAGLPSIRSSQRSSMRSFTGNDGGAMNRAGLSSSRRASFERGPCTGLLCCSGVVRKLELVASPKVGVAVRRQGLPEPPRPARRADAGAVLGPERLPTVNSVQFRAGELCDTAGCHPAPGLGRSKAPNPGVARILPGRAPWSRSGRIGAVRQVGKGIATMPLWARHETRGWMYAAGDGGPMALSCRLGKIRRGSGRR